HSCPLAEAGEPRPVDPGPPRPLHSRHHQQGGPMRLLVVLLLALPLGAAPAPFLPRKMTPAEAEMKTLQGEWVRAGGRRPTGGRLMRYSWGVAGDRVSLVLPGGGVCWRSKFTVDTSASPGVISEKAVTPSFRWRYRLEGDTLTLCDKGDGVDLPDSFTP